MESDELEFEWDSLKADLNKRKHGISFDSARTAFADSLSITIPDPDHSIEEDRFLLMGNTASGMLVVVIFTQRADKIRLISARRASSRERRYYEQAD